MIEKYKDITSENPHKQVWKLLRMYLDERFVAEEIRRIHNVPPGQQTRNIRKQARQVGYAIRQAEEYFRASSEVGLPTRPSLLYYGAVSLSQAMVLLKNDGGFSLDKRRKGKKHNHHGLEFDRGKAESIKPISSVQNFFDSLQCNVHVANEGAPWGHYALFYQSLDLGASGVKIQFYEPGGVIRKATTHGTYPYPTPDIPPLSTQNLQRFNALEIIRMLPEMYFNLKDLGVQPNLCRGLVQREITNRTSIDEQGNEILQEQTWSYHFFINDLTTEHKNKLIEFYEQKNPGISVENDFGASIHLTFSEVIIPSEPPPPPVFIPDILDDVSGGHFFLLDPQASYIPEPASQLVILFCLRILSSYYPDKWMRVIDNNVQIAETCDTLLNIIHRKFPNLILDQLTNTKHFIHL